MGMGKSVPLEGWDQLPGEPDDCFKYFKIYLTKTGGTRSLGAVSRFLAAQSKDKSADDWKGEIDWMRKKWHWAGRAMAFEIRQRTMNINRVVASAEVLTDLDTMTPEQKMDAIRDNYPDIMIRVQAALRAELAKGPDSVDVKVLKDVAQVLRSIADSMESFNGKKGGNTFNFSIENLNALIQAPEFSAVLEALGIKAAELEEAMKVVNGIDSKGYIKAVNG